MVGMASTLNPILSSLGLSAPNPAAYSDASAVANQKSQSVAGLQTVMTTMNTALTVATTTGAPPQYVDELKKKIADGNGLLAQSATMSPAQLQEKTSSLQSQFSASQFTMTQNDYNTQVSQLNAVIVIVQKRVTEVRADKSTSSELLSQYNDLLRDARAAVKTLIDSPPVYKSESELSGSTSGSSASYIIPTVLSADSIQSSLDDLNDKKEQEEGSGFSLTRLYMRFQRMYKSFYTPLFYIIVFFSAILGGIIVSNAYAEVESGAVLNRLFYFIYGMILYPFALVYSCIPGLPTSILKPLTAWPGKTPYWSAGLFPAYMRSPIQIIPAMTDTSQQGGNLAALASAVSTAAAKAKKAVTSVVKSVKKAVTPVSTNTSTNGVQTFTMESVVKDSAGVVTSSNEIPPTTAGDRLFSYVIVDPKHPSDYQKTNRNTLFYASATALAGNLLLLIHYGFL